MIRRLLCFLLLAAGLSTACTRNADPAPSSTFDEASIALMRELTPQLTGTWTLHEVHVQFKPGFSYPGRQSFQRDTTMYQFATLSLQPASLPASAVDPRYPQLEGQLTYQGLNYPVRLRLLATADRVLRQQGPYATFLLEYMPRISGGSRLTTPTEEFLQFVGLLGENFSLELPVGGQPVMIWRGVSHGIERIELRK
jgi:hypothetical protein